jgi:hypothetical protein
MKTIRQTVLGRLTQVTAAGALAAMAGLSGALATGPAASASPVARDAGVATTPTWRMQAPPEPGGTIDRTFGDVSCTSSSACLAIAANDFPHNPDITGTFAETWNGSHWTVRTVPNGTGLAHLYAVNCRSARWCQAVGTVETVGNNYAPLADRWNGRAWTQVTPPVPARATTSDLSAVACSATRACTAVGSSAVGSHAPRLLAERWNGSRWKMQPMPEPAAGGGLLEAIACPKANACRALGFDNTGLFSEVWNGSSWAVRPVPVPAGGISAGLNSISCPTADRCEAVGTYEKDGTFLPLAEVWNGSRWRLQALSTASGAKSTDLNAVSCLSATDCEAAGDAQTSASTQVGLLEKWNGTKWSVQKKVLPAGDALARLNGIWCTTGPVCEAVGWRGSSPALLALRYSSR